eukprot:96325_1
MASVYSFLHNMEHLNHSLAPVSNAFILPQSYSDIYNFHTDDQYEQSIQMFFIFPLEIAAIYILAYIIIVLIYCCYGKPLCIAFNLQTYVSKRRNSDDDRVLLRSKKYSNRSLKISLTPCAKWTRITLAIGSFILIASSIYCAILLDETANIIGDNINASYTPYSQNIIYGTECNKSLSLTINNVGAKNELINSEIYLNKYLLEAQAIPSWSSTTSYLTFSHSFSQFVIYFGMLISVVLAVCFFMSIFSNTMVKFMSCLTFICILILLTLFSLQFAFSINVSDACSNPNNAILQIAKNNTSNE